MAIVVSFAVVAAGFEVQKRNVAAAAARRLASLRQVSADGPYGFELHAAPPPSLSAALDMTFSLRNDGPRDVTVTRASAAEFVLLAPVALTARTRRDVVLHQKVDCTADTLQPLQPKLNRTTSDSRRWPGPLQVTVGASHDTQTITFPRPPYDNERVAALCDWLRGGRPGKFGTPP